MTNQNHNHDALRQTMPQEDVQRPHPHHIPDATETNLAKDLPDTPSTTLSAIVGYIPAFEQESRSRAAAKHLHTEAQSKTEQPVQQQIASKQTSEKPEKSSSNLKKALKNLNPNKKKGKRAQTHKRTPNPENKHKDVFGNAYDSSRGLYAKHPSITQPWESMLSIQRPQYGVQQFPAQPHNMVDTYIGTGMHNNLQPPLNTSYFPFSHQNPHFYHQNEPADFSIAIGGQVRHPQTHRMPSTFLTPTNTNTYAVSGRSHRVSGHQVTSHHADIVHTPHHDNSAQPTPSAHPTIFVTIPTVDFAPDNNVSIEKEPDHSEEETSEEHNSGSNIPGVPFSMQYLDDHLKHSGHRKKIAERRVQAHREIRRSASVPPNLMMRGSAIPSPLQIRKTPIQAEKSQESVIIQTPLVQTPTRIKDEYIVAAFDGVHKHLEDVRAELGGRMGRLEEKLDRVVSLLSASAAAVAQQKKRQQQQQQREIRPNLTGLPPHIPFGGMEGWYNAVRK